MVLCCHACTAQWNSFRIDHTCRIVIFWHLLQNIQRLVHMLDGLYPGKPQGSPPPPSTGSAHEPTSLSLPDLLCVLWVPPAADLEGAGANTLVPLLTTIVTSGSLLLLSSLVSRAQLSGFWTSPLKTAPYLLPLFKIVETLAILQFARITSLCI